MLNISFHHPFLSSARATEGLREGGVGSGRKSVREGCGHPSKFKQHLKTTAETLLGDYACYFGIYFCSTQPSVFVYYRPNQAYASCITIYSVNLPFLRDPLTM